MMKTETELREILKELRKILEDAKDVLGGDGQHE